MTLDRPPASEEDLRSLCYTTLVRTLSNILLCAVPKPGQPGDGGRPAYEMYFTTPEAGFYHLAFDPERVTERILPIAGSRFAIANRISEDLPERVPDLRRRLPPDARMRRMDEDGFFYLVE